MNPILLIVLPCTCSEYSLDAILAQNPSKTILLYLGILYWSDRPPV